MPYGAPQLNKHHGPSSHQSVPAKRSACWNGQAPAARRAAERLSARHLTDVLGLSPSDRVAGLENARVHSIGGFSPYQHIARDYVSWQCEKAASRGLV